MYFSIQTQGFYVNDDIDDKIIPADAVKVSNEIEGRIRKLIISGSFITKIEGSLVYSEQMSS